MVELTCEDVCLFEPEVGPCDGDFPRWFYDASTGSCELFSWGGCEGNANNFSSAFDCQARCATSLP